MKSYKTEQNMRIRQGQASIEFLTVSAVSILVLILIFSIIYRQIVDIGIQQENANTEQTISKLAQAARGVYVEGSGASRKVRIILPSDYDASGSGIINNSIIIKIRGTHRVENLPFSVYGSLPQTHGSHEVLVQSQGSSVFFGNSLFMINPLVVSTLISNSTTKTEYITITNTANETINVNSTLNWTPTDISVSVSPQTFVLASYAQQTVNLSFVSSNTLGSYFGTLTFFANSTLANNTQILNIYAEVYSKP